MTTRILIGDCRDVLRTLPERSVQMCLTSPPYFGLRDYGHADQIGLDWRVAFALQADGWFSVTDRPTKAHEYLFLFAKSERYYYDAEAIAEQSVIGVGAERNFIGNPDRHDGGRRITNNGTRNRRSVWTVPTLPYSGAHFATFPPKLIEPCILAGASPQACEQCGAPWERVVERPDFSEQPKRKTSKDAHLRNGDRTSAGQKWQEWRNANPDRLIGWQRTCECANNGTARSVVLDPFGGAGTTGLVCDRLGRDAILIELNPAYAALSDNRVTDDAPLFADVSVDTNEGK